MGLIITTKTAEAVEVALREVGVREASGRNDGVPSTRYQQDPWDPSICRRVPWCSIFLLWVFDQVEDGPRLYHTRKQWYRFARVARLWEHWEGCAIREGLAPEPGDLLVMNARGQSDPSATGWHIGITLASTSDRVVTIDGNWKNRVDLVSRPRADPRIVGYLRIR